MQLSYTKLWDTLNRMNMTKAELLKITSISKSTLAKITHGDNVNTDILVKICTALNCDISDIMEIIKTPSENESKKINGAAGTFSLNKNESIHRWYKYLEGYSSCLIEKIFNECGPNIKSVYDPFAGTGTTLLVASSRNIVSYYSETNPFMKDVIEAKINIVKDIRRSEQGTNYLKEIRQSIVCSQETMDIPVEWDGFEKYFSNSTLSKILTIKDEISKCHDKPSQKLAMTALAAVLVQSSKMIRQGDLRYAKHGEKPEDDVIDLFINKLDEIINDIDSNSPEVLSSTKCLNEDARFINEHNLVDCIITSPPYLNGTNYIRNTKLELKLFDYIQTENDLPHFHSKGIIAGINNVSKRNVITAYPLCVQPYIDKLIPLAYDSRIPVMVKGYFHDMDIVIRKLSNVIKDGGKFIMDIGDSQFAGVHIPTHEILTQICSDHGFELYDEEILRERRSKNGMVLTQRLLKFVIHKSTQDSKNFEKAAKTFIEEMPYKQGLYASRNWGHQLHSLCSYHGKLKPSIAHFLVKNFTEPNEIVLDPLGGVGTIPLEACLQGRVGISNDLSEMAYVVAKAKVEMPDKQEVYRELNELQAYIGEHKNTHTLQGQVSKYSSFGFNGKLSEYYHSETLKEIICAREYYVQRLHALTPAQAMCMSCLLHVLHGNRPYALSRNSHPLTPYAPTGEYVYKNVIEHIKAKIDIAYKEAINLVDYVRGKSLLGDFSMLSTKSINADAIISSPPFADSIRFYMQNWLRLWFCGWEQEDFKNADDKFLDTQQKSNFDVYKAFFDMCYQTLKPNGKVILHLGKTDKYDMSKELIIRAKEQFNVVYAGEEDVSEIEKHGIKDKGKTIKHQFLFLTKKGE